MDETLSTAAVRLGKALAAAMVRAKLNPTDLSKRSSVSRETIYQIRDGTRLPTTEVLIRLAAELDADPGSLLAGIVRKPGTVGPLVDTVLNDRSIWANRAARIAAAQFVSRALNEFDWDDRAIGEATGVPHDTVRRFRTVGNIHVITDEFFPVALDALLRFVLTLVETGEALPAAFIRHERDGITRSEFQDLEARLRVTEAALSGRLPERGQLGEPGDDQSPPHNGSGRKKRR